MEVQNINLLENLSGESHLRTCGKKEGSDDAVCCFPLCVRAVTGNGFK